MVDNPRSAAAEAHVPPSPSGSDRVTRDRSRAAPPPLSDEDARLLESLTPDLARLLYPDQSTEPFTVTVTYPELTGADAAAASELTAAAFDHSVLESPLEGQAGRQSTTFTLGQVQEFHELYHLLETAVGGGRMEVALNGREVPLTRELWLPLIWELRK